VLADGTLAARYPTGVAVSSSSIGTGQYQLSLPTPPTGYDGWIGVVTPNGGLNTVGAFNVDPTTMQIEIFNSAGSPANDIFQIILTPYTTS
jgi:hypothetical protein